MEHLVKHLMIHVSRNPQELANPVVLGLAVGLTAYVIIKDLTK